jgi:hypothetical protein
VLSYILPPSTQHILLGSTEDKLCRLYITKVGTKIMPPIFLEILIAITVKFTWMICTSFAIMRPFSYKVFIIYNTILPTLSKMLYASTVKFPASTSEHMMKSLFQSLAICKMAST